MDDLIRVEANERVDINDFVGMTEAGIGPIREAMGNLITDPAQTRKWVVSGFAMTNPSAKQLQVARGVAIAAWRDSGTVRYGMLITQGDATKTIDLNSYAAGTYGVYVRFQFVPGEAESRTFWDPTGAGSEYAQTIDTRYEPNWSLRVEATNPGDEWLQIGEVAQATMAITDMRPFFFEGAVDASYASGWSTEGGGVANDRNADRASYGVSNLQQFTAAMRQCITDLRGRGLKAWYEKGIGGMNIGFDTNPSGNVLAVGDASFALQYNAGTPLIVFDIADLLEYNRLTNALAFRIGGVDELTLDASALVPQDDGLDLGDGTHSFKDAYITRWHPGTADGEGCQGDLKPTADASLDLGSSGRQWADLHLSGAAYVAGDGIFGSGISVGSGTPASDKTIVLGAAGTFIEYAAGPVINMMADSACGLSISGASDKFDFYTTSGAAAFLDATRLSPGADNGNSLGSATARWLNAFAESLWAHGDAAQINLYQDDGPTDGKHFRIYQDPSSEDVLFVFRNDSDAAGNGIMNFVRDIGIDNDDLKEIKVHARFLPHTTSALDLGDPTSNLWRYVFSENLSLDTGGDNGGVSGLVTYTGEVDGTGASVPASYDRRLKIYEGTTTYYLLLFSSP